jgi:UDP-glucose:(heptosyl)LPS alpha-1,3-glucosyltransferase
VKIWIIRRRFTDAGGAERFTDRLATALTQKGYEAIVVAEEWPKDRSYKVATIQSCDPYYFARECHEFLHELLPSKDGIVFSLERTLKQHIYRAGDGVHRAWLQRRAPFESWIKNAWANVDFKHRAFLRLEKKLFDPANTGWVIANSRMVKDEILSSFEFPEDRIRVIQSGVNLAKFQPCTDTNRKSALRKSLSLPSHAVVWSFVGSGFQRKGLRFAIEIAAKQKTEVWLAVLGKGETYEYEVLAHKFGLGNRLRFLPLGTSALDVYQSSDAFILPTIYDPCANACLEAAACGLPVITTNANGAAEWISNVQICDLENLEEAVQKSASFAQPIKFAADLESQRSKLDEKPCWDSVISLIENIER